VLLNANSAILQLYHINFQLNDDEVCFLIDQYAEFNFHSASSLKQQSMSQPVCALSP
jgi:hypothetical protein